MGRQQTHPRRTIILTFTLTLLALAPSSVTAAPAGPKGRRAITPITDGSQVNGKTYDYVIAGGGLTGVVVASRLSEDSSKRVLVIEAGGDAESDPNVYDARNYQNAFNTKIDWAYKTTPQTSGNGNTAQQIMRSGKALGGSTTINGMAWSKPHDFQIDAMEQVGNPGLNWKSLQTYMLRAETFTPPSSSQYGRGVTYTPSCHGGSGPLGTQFDPAAQPDAIERAFNLTVQAQGLPYATDLTCGNPAGRAPIANTRSGNTRNDAYRAYLYTQTRPNLTILSGATVGKVQLSSGSTPTAQGLEFRDQSGNTYSVTAALEVIMALGSIKTPVILQQSGIGPSDVLSSAGVTQKVDLPIGLNLIDQTTTTTDWNYQNGNAGGGQPITFPRFSDLFTGSDATTMTNMLQNDLPSYVTAAISSGAASQSQAAGLQQVFEIQRDWILNKGVGVSENFDYTYNGNVLGYDSWYLLPFGRGSIKIGDNQPYGGNFNINPQYFTNAFDRLAQGATARYTRQVSQGEPLNRYAYGEFAPGKNAVGDGASLSDWANWAEQHYRSNWHPIGTAAMMSKNLGGSVDSNYKVYGVNNLRIVDASVLPFQVSSHLMSVLYGLSERASDIIKAAHSGPITSSSSSSATSTSSSSSSSSTAPPSQTGVPIHPKSFPGKCLDVVNGNIANGAQVQIWDCNGKPQQKWTLNRGASTVKLAGTNYCLDAGNTPGSGTQMKIWTCIDRIPAQSWQYNGDGTIGLQSQSQCLDLTNGSSNNGNIVQIWSCSSANPNQLWTSG